MKKLNLCVLSSIQREGSSKWKKIKRKEEKEKLSSKTGDLNEKTFSPSSSTSPRRKITSTLRKKRRNEKFSKTENFKKLKKKKMEKKRAIKENP